MKTFLPKLIGGSVAAVVVVTGCVVYRHYKNKDSGQVQYQTAAIERGRVVAQVTASGTLQPRVTVQVGSQVSGRILELHADFNSEVKKGQLLARLDPKLLDASVVRARAEQTSAQASLGRANAMRKDAFLKYERAKGLAAKKLVAQADLDSALATYLSAQAQVTTAWADLQQAKAALEQARTNQQYATIVSPIDGVVISRDVDVGQTVAASLQAPTLFTIAEDLRSMQIHTSVAESDVGKVHAKQEVVFTVDAFPSERFPGVVKQIRYAPKTESNVVTYDAVISVDNKELKLRPGMTANVTFIIARKRNTLLISNAALRFQPAPEVVQRVAPELARSRRGAEGGRRRGRGRDGHAQAGAASSSKPVGEEGRKPGAGAPKPTGEGGKSGRAAGGKPGAAVGTGAAKTGERRAAGNRRGMRGGRRRSSPERVVWVLGEDEQPKPVKITIGISDGSVTEIVKGDLKEGDKVIVGTGKSKGPARRRRGRRGFL